MKNVLHITVAGISGSGKTAVACKIADVLREYGINVEINDMDVIHSTYAANPEHTEDVLQVLGTRGTIVNISTLALKRYPLLG